MPKTFSIVLFSLFLAFTVAPQRVQAEEMITLSLPQAVLARTVSAFLPYKVEPRSKTISGNIVIQNISEIALAKNLLTCRLHLIGNDLALSTELAGHKIKLNVGSTEISFKADAAVRFDRKKQILYVTPMARELQGGDAGSKPEIGQALVALFHGQEFPIQLQKIQPLVADTGSKEVTINSRIARVAVVPGAIKVGLVPIITTK